MKKEKDLQVLLNSGVYYLGYDTSVEIKRYFSLLGDFLKKTSLSLKEMKRSLVVIFILNIMVFQKPLHWDAPYCNKEIEEFIEKKILLLKDIANNNASSMIPSVEFLFDVDPLKYEDCCFSNE